MIFVRFLLWAFGMMLSAVPLFAAIAVSPTALPKLFALESYITFYGELIFMSVAIGALSVAESAELLLDLDPKKESKKIIAAVICLLALLVVVVLGGVWYGRFLAEASPGRAIPVAEVLYVGYILGGVLSAALVLKLMFWARHS